MDVALLLLLPLVGGYYFATTANCCRYRSAREEGHRLYFRAAFYGSFLFVSALFIRVFLLDLECYRSFEQMISYWVLQLVKEPEKGYQFPLTLTAFYSMLFSVPFAWISNIFFSEEIWLEKALKYSDLERVVHRAWSNSMPVCLSMDNCKVYVGFVVTTTDPMRDRKSIGVLPIISGYRNAEGRIIFTTDYRAVYEKLNHESLENLTPRDFEVALPADKIHSCNLFDFRAYEMFSKNTDNVRKFHLPWVKRDKNKSWAGRS